MDGEDINLLLKNYDITKLNTRNIKTHSPQLYARQRKIITLIK